jgi:dihydrofolate synthase / folylpolyglutamate synthase
MTQEGSLQDSEYTRCLEQMFKLQRFGIKLGLETIGSMLRALGNPEKHFNCIHIAGTNGKGSVAAMLSSMLLAAGFTVGRYTSPHLERFNERICVNDEPIDDDAVVASCRRVLAVADLPRQPTFFEFTTAMALDQFARRQVQWAIIETGMGGRLDATNVIQPAVCVITNISLEHRAYLGDTLSAIAGEKAGIIKSGIPVVTGVRQASARGPIAHQANIQNAPIYRQGHDFRCRRTGPAHFNYHGITHTWRALKLGLSGEHQVDNASLALATCELLERCQALQLPETALRQGLERTRWPGRLELAAIDPQVILDGAHNLMSARLLSRYLKRHFKDRNITLVVGILDDKPYRSMMKDLVEPCRRVIITKPKIDRAMNTAPLADCAAKHVADVAVIEDVGDALRHAMASSKKEDVIVVAGSLYVVGEAKTALAAMPRPTGAPSMGQGIVEPDVACVCP